MFKKTLVLGGVVALLLGWFGRSHVMTTVGMVKESVKDSVPVGFEIKRARQMIKDLQPEIERNMHVIAREETEVAKLERQLTSLEGTLAKDRDDILRLKKDLDKGFNLFMNALTRPTFPEEEIRREVEKIVAAIQSAEDQPDEVAEKEFQKTLFPESPYGHPAEGTKESLPKLTREALVRFYQTYYHPNNAILTVVGDITTNEVEKKLLPHLF